MVLIEHPTGSRLSIADLDQYFAEAPVQYLHHCVDLLGRDRQGRAEGDPVGVEAAEKAVLEGPTADPDAEGQRVGVTGFCPAVLDEFDGVEQPLSANVPDRGVPLRHFL